MEKNKLVVIGNGMAGIKCVEEIVRLSPDAYEITVFGSEPRPNYNRILLSKVLQGSASNGEIILNDWSWYEENGIRLHAGETVERILVSERRVRTESGMTVPYDRLIVATGSTAFIPPIPGIDKPGVTGFRTIDDCDAIKEAAKRGTKAAVIGGGLLGLEAARGLLNLGMQVDVVHNASYLMNRQLDRVSAEMLRKELESQGMRFLLGKQTVKVAGRKKAEGLLFSDGTKLAADLIVVAVGIRPNVAVAEKSGIATHRAIVVNDYLQTNVQDVYAVGECAEHRGIVYGLVSPLYEQGKVLARTLCGLPTEPYAGSIPFAQLKVSGVEMFSAGLIGEQEAETAYQAYDGVRGTYRKVTSIGGKVAGAILYGDASDGPRLLDLLKRGASVSVLSQEKPAEADGSLEAAQAMPDSGAVCACNGVSKGAILCSIREDGAKTVEQVRDKTKASGSCGGCRPLVAALIRLAEAAGPGGGGTPEPAVCGCADMGHAAIKEAVRAETFDSAEEAMAALGWKRPSGCPTCRGALRYYIELEKAAFAPAGLSSVTRANGDRSPGLRVRTGSARASASGEAFVLTPPELGSELEASFQGLRLPAPAEAAVSGGANDPVGHLVSAFGLLSAPAGWELYGGGHAEHPVKPAQLVAAGLPEALALDMAVACVQWYRHTAFYGEAVWEWIDRVGVSAVRERLLDPETREEWLDSWRAERTGAMRSAGADESVTHAEEAAVR